MTFRTLPIRRTNLVNAIFDTSLNNDVQSEEAARPYLLAEVSICSSAIITFTSLSLLLFPRRTGPNQKPLPRCQRLLAAP
eukprot:g9509.t1